MDRKQMILNIHNAIRNRNATEAIALLSKDKSLLEIWTPFGTWLHDAAEHGSLDTVRWLISMGLNVNAYDDRNEEPPLAVACAQGNLEIATSLIEAGAGLDTADSVRNPLLSAIVGGDSEAHTQIAKLLIELGIDTSIRYPKLDNMNALEFAQQYGRKEIVKLLE